MIEDNTVTDTLERLYALAVTGQEQGAPKIALCVGMLLRRSCCYRERSLRRRLSIRRGTT